MLTTHSFSDLRHLSLLYNGLFGGCYGCTLWPFHYKGGNAHCSVRNSTNAREKNTVDWHRPFLSSHAALLVAMLCVDLAGSRSLITASAKV
jgi:hypothetical protein